MNNTPNPKKWYAMLIPILNHSFGTAVTIGAVYYENKPCGNIIKASSVLAVIAGCGYLAMDKPRKRGNCPRWFAIATSYFEITLMLAFGWFWCSAAAIWAMSCIAVLDERHPPEEISTPKPEPEI